MAIHSNIESMLRESLLEMLSVVGYCINFRKDKNLWNGEGCYGYPAALLLLSIVDSVGSYVEKGSVENHFKILNNKDYYNLNLTKQEIDIIYKEFRSLLSHNSVISPNLALKVNTAEGIVLIKTGNGYELNLDALYAESIKAVEKILLNNGGVFANNQTMINIMKKARGTIK